jgi:phage gpG-like protein
MASTKAPVSTTGVKKPKGGQAKVFGLTTTGTQESAAVLNSVGGRGADARPAWPVIFKLMQADTAERFNRDGEGDWQKLAASTIDAKARKHQDPRIMRASGALYKSLTGDTGRGALRRKSRYQMRYGTSVFYARFHQTGKGVPKRELITVDAALTRQIVDALERYVSKGELPERLRPGGF